jgi:hypothetical protein
MNVSDGRKLSTRNIPFYSNGTTDIYNDLMFAIPGPGATAVMSKANLNKSRLKSVTRDVTTPVAPAYVSTAPVSTTTVAAAPVLTTTTHVATNDNMTIYKITGNKVESSATVTLRAIREAHIKKQNAILSTLAINGKIASLYNWIDTNPIINNDMDSYNKFYRMFMDAVSKIIVNVKIEGVIRNARMSITNTNTSIKSSLNDMLVNGNAFTLDMSRIFNMLKDINKFKFILYEITNNIFNVLALENNVAIRIVIDNISKLTKSNIYENYFTNGNPPIYYMSGIDTAIATELQVAVDKYTPVSSNIPVSKGATSKIRGGTRKTKKRQVKKANKKQSRKTKKQIHNHKK